MNNSRKSGGSEILDGLENGKDFDAWLWFWLSLAADSFDSRHQIWKQTTYKTLHYIVGELAPILLDLLEPFPTLLKPPMGLKAIQKGNTKLQRFNNDHIVLQPPIIQIPWVDPARFLLFILNTEH